LLPPVAIEVTADRHLLVSTEAA